MITWWTSLSLFLKIIWGITLVSSLIFVIQTLLTFIGADSFGDGFDADFGDIPSDAMADAVDSGSGMNLLTFRNVVNFFLGFGWTAVLFYPSIESPTLLMLLSVVVGVFLVLLVMWLFKWLNGMQHSGNINVFRSAVGCQGKVYLSIPAERGGEGKVQISINDAVREYDALTEGDALPTGTPVKVIDVIDAHTLLVEGMTSEII